MKRNYFREGLLRKGKMGKEEIYGSLDLAKKFLEKAGGNLKIEYFDVSFTLAYNTMFHSARALLFSINVKERSHMAMIDYLKEKFNGNKELLQFLNILDSYRITRHAIQYTGELCSRTDAEEAILDAKEFLDLVKRYSNKIT